MRDGLAPDKNDDARRDRWPTKAQAQKGRKEECSACGGRTVEKAFTFTPGLRTGVSSSLSSADPYSMYPYSGYGYSRSANKAAAVRRYTVTLQNRFLRTGMLFRCATSLQLHGTIRRELHCQPLNDSDEEPPPRALSALALPARGKLHHSSLLVASSVAHTPSCLVTDGGLALSLLVLLQHDGVVV